MKRNGKWLLASAMALSLVNCNDSSSGGDDQTPGAGNAKPPLNLTEGKTNEVSSAEFKTKANSVLGIFDEFGNSVDATPMAAAAAPLPETYETGFDRCSYVGDAQVDEQMVESRYECRDESELYCYVRLATYGSLGDNVIYGTEDKLVLPTLLSVSMDSDCSLEVKSDYWEQNPLPVSNPGDINLPKEDENKDIYIYPPTFEDNKEPQSSEPEEEIEIPGLDVFPSELSFPEGENESCDDFYKVFQQNYQMARGAAEAMLQRLESPYQPLIGEGNGSAVQVSEVDALGSQEALKLEFVQDSFDEGFKFEGYASGGANDSEIWIQNGIKVEMDMSKMSAANMATEAPNMFIRAEMNGNLLANEIQKSVQVSYGMAMNMIIDNQSILMNIGMIVDLQAGDRKELSAKANFNGTADGEAVNGDMGFKMTQISDNEMQLVFSANVTGEEPINVTRNIVRTSAGTCQFK